MCDETVGAAAGGVDREVDITPGGAPGVEGNTAGEGDIAREGNTTGDEGIARENEGGAGGVTPHVCSRLSDESNETNEPHNTSHDLGLTRGGGGAGGSNGSIPGGLTVNPRLPGGNEGGGGAGGGDAGGREGGTPGGLTLPGGNQGSGSAGGVAATTAATASVPAAAFATAAIAPAVGAGGGEGGTLGGLRVNPRNTAGEGGIAREGSTAGERDIAGVSPELPGGDVRCGRLLCEPCACRGASAAVHEGCLAQWLGHCWLRTILGTDE